MKSPFPGMDPYLEEGAWSTFHLQFLVEMKRQMMDALLPDFYPLIDCYRVVTLDSSLRFVPTEAVVKERAPIPPRPAYVNHALPHSAGVSFIRIQEAKTRTTRGVIHVLEPIIKKAPGRRHYLRWRATMLGKSFPFIEIDLLRQGRRPPMLDPYPDSPYCVMITDPKLHPCCEVWPIHLQQKLPAISVAVARERMVRLDLQRTFDETFDKGYLERIVDYQRELELPFSAADETWVQERLRQHQLLIP